MHLDINLFNLLICSSLIKKHRRKGACSLFIVTIPYVVKAKLSQLLGEITDPLSPARSNVTEKLCHIFYQFRYETGINLDPVQNAPGFETRNGFQMKSL